MTAQTPRLHMGCGEALRSHWLLNLARLERERERARKPKPGKPKRERTRG